MVDQNSEAQSQFVDSRSAGILWLRPGVHRTISFETFKSLFRDADFVCRVLHDLEFQIQPGKDMLHFKAGDAIAAATSDKEDRLYHLLRHQGVQAGDVVIEPGAKRQHGPAEHAGKITDERKDKGPPQVGG